MTQSAWFETLGCKANQYETRWLCAALATLGWSPAPEPAGAELVVVNTCAVTAEAERKSRQALGRARRCSPRARVVAVGCLVAALRQRGQELGSADLALVDGARAEGFGRLAAWLGAAAPARGPSLPGLGRQTRALIKVQDGCAAHCTYCLIPSLRGPSRSRSLAEVEAEARPLWEAGIPEVVLTGVCLGAWSEEAHDLPILVRTLAGLPGRTRLRLSSLEPEALGGRLLDALAEAGPERVCPHLHLPLQHGSDRILRRMGRPYTWGSYLERVLEARRRLLEPALTTDVIVGFPGEQETDLEATLQALELLHPVRVHVFPYSPRQGTAASRLPGQVPGAVIRERARRVRELAERLSREAAAARVGRLEDVILEGARSGLSGRYQRVRVGQGRPGERFAVRILGVRGPALVGRRLE